MKYLMIIIIVLSALGLVGLPLVRAQHDSHDHSEHEEHSAHEATEAHDDHEGHEAPGESSHEEHDDALSLTAAEMQELGITLAQAAPGTMHVEVELPGEVRLNDERLAHVVPRLAGIVRDVRVSLGDQVKQGEVLAVLDSRELAQAKSQWLAAKERHNLAQALFNREARLWKDKISAENDYLEAKNAVAEERIAMQAAKQELLALGLSEDLIESINATKSSLTRLEIIAPIDGTITEKHLTLGEYVEANSDVFTVADLSTVWVDLSVYQKHLADIEQGQAVTLTASGKAPEVQSVIAYVGPVVGEDTRTALARIILPNPDNHWKPGLFVTARIDVSSTDVALLIPETAVQQIEGKAVVFVQHDDGLEPASVVLGGSSHGQVEVVNGLQAGQTYVATGGFHLKAELNKEAFAHSGHNH